MTEKLEYYNRRLASLKAVRHDWEDHWRELARNILPYNLRYLQEGQGSPEFGGRRNNYIIDGTAGHCVNLAAIGLFNGLTPKQIPWMRLAVDHKDLAEYPPVTEWLHDVSSKNLQVFAASNFYQSIFNFYKESLVFGMAGLFLDKNHEKVMTFVPLSIGEFWIAQNHQGEINTCYRQFYATPRQLAERFGEEKLSRRTREMLKPETMDRYVRCFHAVEERGDYGHAAQGPVARERKRYASAYFEEGRDDGGFLSLGGYDRFPFLIVPWDTAGNNVYGYSPAMNALPDILELQSLQEDKRDIVAKMSNPPMKAPASFRQMLVNLSPGGITYVDPIEGGGFLEPIMPRAGSVDGIQLVINELTKSIREHFYVDFLMMFSSEHRSNVTATEIMERKAEKLTVASTFTSRVEQALLDKCVTAVFGELLERGLIGPMPRELERAHVEISYQSAISQAQRATAVSAINQVALTVAQLSQADPKVMDKFDGDQAVDEVMKHIGAPPSIVRSDEAVAELRAAREEQQQQMAAAIN